MTMLGGLSVVFLEALNFVEPRAREQLVKQWNEQCEEVYKYKNALIEEEHIKATAYGRAVAREIFDRFDRNMVTLDPKLPCYRAINLNTFNILKKKYTEEQT